MKHLARLHEEFIDKARLPMNFGKLPVMPRGADVPLIPVNKWLKESNLLKKKYEFRLKSQKREFVTEILDHEEEVGHSPLLTIEEDSVTVTLQTKDIESITELDKEFAKWLDELYKDVVYSLSDD